MTRQLNKLTAAQVKQIKFIPKKNNKYTDGGGLTLEITSAGSKIWRLRYRHPITGKEQTLTIGNYPLITLLEARDKRDIARRQLLDGIDPNQVKLDQRQTAKIHHENTFNIIKDEWLHIRQIEGKKDDEVIRRLNHDAVPFIGELSISYLTTDRLYELVFSSIIQRNALTVAKKLKQSLHGIFEHARRNRRLITMNPVEDINLPQPKPRHFAAITRPSDLTPFIKDSWSYIDRPRVSPVTAYALQLSILIFQRPTEIRALRWEQFKDSYEDFDGRCLETTPLKQDGHESVRETLVIPLTQQVIKIFDELRKLTGHSEYIFYSPVGKEPYLSEGTVLGAIKRIDGGKYIGKQTAHGLRATASTILEERLDQPKAWIEAQLAHKVSDANGEAYNRTSHLDNRLKLLQVWEDYIYHLLEG